MNPYFSGLLTFYVEPHEKYRSNLTLSLNESFETAEFLKHSKPLNLGKELCKLMRTFDGTDIHTVKVQVTSLWNEDGDNLGSLDEPEIMISVNTYRVKGGITSKYKYQD